MFPLFRSPLYSTVSKFSLVGANRKKSQAAFKEKDRENTYSNPGCAPKTRFGKETPCRYNESCWTTKIWKNQNGILLPQKWLSAQARGVTNHLHILKPAELILNKNTTWIVPMTKNFDKWKAPSGAAAVTNAWIVGKIAQTKLNTVLSVVKSLRSTEHTHTSVHFIQFFQKIWLSVFF